FFQAEDGIRAGHVTGVQTCALPISTRCGVEPCVATMVTSAAASPRSSASATAANTSRFTLQLYEGGKGRKGRRGGKGRKGGKGRSEERRVGKEWRWEGGREDE